MNNPKFWEQYKEVDDMLKQAFIQMPGGQPQSKEAQDPAAGGAGGMPPPGMDPSMMGGAGGAPMDPAMMGAAGAAGAAGGMPPGMDPSMAGGAPMDPAMAGGLPPGMGVPPPGMEDPTAQPNAAPGSPMITISLDQLFEIIQKVLGLAKKVGVNGQGVQQPAPAAPAAPEASGITPDQLKSTIYEALGSMVN